MCVFGQCITPYDGLNRETLFLFPDAPLITQWSSTTRPTHKISVLAWKPSSMSANTLTCLCTVELKSATPRIQTQGALEAA